VRPRPEANGPSAIVVDAAFGDWQAVQPEFRDTIGDVTHRDHPGYGDTVYTNASGRNDFVIAKAAYDDTQIYFFAQTSAAISPHTDPNWMLLLLDADQDAATGWLGYDFVVNLEPGVGETSLHAWQAGTWARVGTMHYAVNGNGLELAISRALIAKQDGAPAFDFHWADNIAGFGDVSELGVNGDSAPNRRSNYRFSVRK